MDAMIAFQAKVPSVTLEFQNALIARGELGQIAFGLFRAQKRSTRAKSYRRRSHRDSSYKGKEEALTYLDAVLSRSAEPLQFRWGWKADPNQEFHNQVLYVDVPQFGQCSFHSAKAASDHKYPGEWRRESITIDVVVAFSDWVFDKVEPVGALGDDDLMPFGWSVGKRLGSLNDKEIASLGKFKGLGSWPLLRDYVAARSNPAEVQP